jgi:hypothetical protein
VQSALPFTALSLSRRVLDEALLTRAAQQGCIVERGVCADSREETTADPSTALRTTDLSVIDLFLVHSFQSEKYAGSLLHEIHYLGSHLRRALAGCEVAATGDYLKFGLRKQLMEDLPLADRRDLVFTAPHNEHWHF